MIRKALFSGAVLTLLFGSHGMAQFGSTVQYFPQFAIDGGAVTVFTIHNPGQSPVTVNLQLIRSDGSILLSDQVQVAGGATETVSFGGSSGTAEDGWAKLFSDRNFTASLFYRISGVGNVGVLPSSEAKALQAFTFIESGTNTGFAVANPSPGATADLMFRIYDAAGSLQREATLSLPPLHHDAFFFTEEPYLATSNGSVSVTATSPVVAVGLRLDGTLLAGVPVIVPGLPIRAEWNDESPNLIGGHDGNRVREGAVGGTIGGGGNSVDLPDGGANFVTASFGTVGGGKRNTADDHAIVGGGDRNVASGPHSTVGGGLQNTASESGSAVLGGIDNTASGRSAALCGGERNTANAEWSHVGGGWTNKATSQYASVLGGHDNTAGGYGSAVAGGGSNRAAEDYSFAAGYEAEALHYGSFVWADFEPFLNQNPFRSTAPRQFLIRAENGVGINTNNPQGALDVSGTIYQRGGSLHADYVFEPGYRLESIEEHSRLMWEKKRLPALAATERDSQGRDVVEYGSRVRGLLEELEKAHVYIEQLNARLAEIEKLLKDVDAVKEGR